MINDLIAKAQDNGAKKIKIYTNSKLHNAVNLYTSYGFKQIPLPKHHKITVDLVLELDLCEPKHQVTKSNL